MQLSTRLPDIAASGLQPAFAKLAKEIDKAGQTALAAGVYVLTGVMNRLIPNIGGLLTYIVPNLLSASLGAVSAVASAVGKIATQFVEAVISLNPEAAWNVAVDGLFGPIGADGTVASSIPGTLEAVTIGNGLGLYGSQSYVSSLRVAVQGAVYSVANNLGGSFPRPTTPLVPTPSATTAAAAAVPAAEAVTAAAAPAAPAAEAITAAAPAAEVVASAGSAAAAAETLPAVGATIDGTPRSAVGRTLGARGTGIRTAESGSGGTAASGASKAPRAAAAAPGRGDQRTSE
jgi:DNA polymerase-3 subunit gamma/tau